MLCIRHSHHRFGLSAIAAKRVQPAPNLCRTASPWKLRFPTPPDAALHKQQFAQRQFRSKSTLSSTGENETGHISTLENESILFLDNVFPLKLSIFFRLPFFVVDIDRYLNQWTSKLSQPGNDSSGSGSAGEHSQPSPLPLNITQVIPRPEEGGVYVKFKYEVDEDPKMVEEKVKARLKEHPIRPWWTFWPVHAALVKGAPWLEDLHRLPSPTVKVEFYPPESGEAPGELSEENLYSLFRTYGRIRDIESQSKDSKELPRYAKLQFDIKRHAVMAKCCMHGYYVPPSEGGGKNGTMIKLTYQRKRFAYLIWQWLLNHPRVALSALAILLSTGAAVILDPIRRFAVEAHVTRSFHIQDFKLYKWFRSQTYKTIELLKLRQGRTEDVGLRAIWDDRKGAIEQIQTWMMESADTFVVIQGPRGSGKKELVIDQALKGRKNTLIVDCKAIQEAQGDSSTICAAASQLGYRPIISWTNSLNSMLDLAAQGTIGTKTGFSETLDAQLQHIWNTASQALRKIALGGRRKDDRDGNLGDDEYLEAHPEKRPVVVIDNFLHKASESTLVYDRLAEWAASLTTANIAHVIFLTSDVTFTKALSKALPDRVFRQISLGDTSPEVAKRFVINHLDAVDTPDENATEEEKHIPPSQRRTDLNELDSVISTLGGRLTDLEFLARRIKSGESPSRAVEEITSQSASEILKMFILDIAPCSTLDDAAKSWSPLAAWSIIKALSQTSELLYNDFVTATSASELHLRALEQAELITITSSPNGRPHLIKPGKPIFTAAFRQLVSDKVLSARMQLDALAAGTSKAEKEVKEARDELVLFGQTPGLPTECRGRQEWLVSKVNGGQEKLEDLERQADEAKKVIAEEGKGDEEMKRKQGKEGDDGKKGSSSWSAYLGWA